MTALAPLLQAFFTDRLMTQYGASPHTIASYRDTFRLLLTHVHQQTGTLPGRLVLAAQTGLRVAELTALTIADTHLGVGAHVYCRGKGRKDRCTPLTAHTVGVLTTWLSAHRCADTDPLFATRRGTPLSHDAVTHLVTKHATVAVRACPSLRTKHVTPHTLRHTAAMRLLHAGVDTTVIALWLGHESPTTTRIYLHADMALKEQAIARTTPPDTTVGRYQPTDALLAFLDQL